MISRAIENLIRWTLAAWMLAATSATSSTFVHGHSDGGRFHRHDSHDYARSQSLPSDAIHDDHDSNLSLSAADVHRHGCLGLLGVITCHSVPAEPSGSPEKSSSGMYTIVAVSLFSQTARTLSKGLATDHSLLAAVAVILTGCVGESKQHEAHCAGIAPASPLCDRARHERSGVQLA